MRRNGLRWFNQVTPMLRPGGVPLSESGPLMSIFGFEKPETAPTTFPGTLLTAAETTATDAAKWSKQNSDAALTIAANHMSANGTQVAARWMRYTDETACAVTDRLAFLAKIESASGSMFLSCNVGSPTGGSNTKLGWKGGTVAATGTAPQIGVSFNTSVTGEFSEFRGYNLTTLQAAPQKWFVVVTAGQSNWIGATAIHDPDIDTPVEGVVVWPGSTNTYTGSTVSVPMAAVDPVQHQTLNGSSTDAGGGPNGAFLRALRDVIPGDYTIVYVAANYAGQGFKTNGLWNKSTLPTPTAYNGFWSRAREVWALAPVGSVMGGLIFCGGESDLGSGNLVEWSSLVTGVPAFINEVRAESGWGDVPVVIAEIGMPYANTDVPAMIATQQKLATGSGDALEFTRCAYVTRPVGATLGGDDIHFDQATHRLRGAEVAQALHDIIYQV